jgi:tetratricopeptide (TPR) repeat protein
MIILRYKQRDHQTLPTRFGWILIIILTLPINAVRGQSHDSEEVEKLTTQGAEALRRGHNERAEILFKGVLGVQEQALGPDHPDLVATLNNLADVYYRLGRYAEAEPFYKRSLSIREKELGADHLDVAASLIDLADLYWSRMRSHCPCL